MIKPGIFLLWGCHSIGKTRFVERAENIHYNRFLPLFGDLYGNKDLVDQKKLIVTELLNFDRPALVEGKRFVDTSVLNAFEAQLTEAHNQNKELHFVIGVSSEEASVRRTNERRVARGQEPNWKYEDGRGPYECKRRFYNKVKELYQRNPKAWSMFRLWVIEAEDDVAAAWKPLEEYVDAHLAQFEPNMVIDPVRFPDMHRFWTLRQDILHKKGQEYFDLKLNGGTQPVPVIPTIQSSSVVLSAQNGEEKKIRPPKAELKATPTTEVVKIKTPTMILTLVPCPQATVSQLSKVRRGFRKAGLAEPAEELLRQVVGGLLAAGIEPTDKGSSWIGTRLKENAALFQNGTPAILPPPTPVAITLQPIAPPPVSTPIQTPSPVVQTTAPANGAAEATPKVVVKDGTVTIENVTVPNTPAASSTVESKPAPTTSNSIIEALKQAVAPKVIQRDTLTAEEKTNHLVLNALTVHVEADNVDGEPQTLEEIDTVVPRGRRFDDNPINTTLELPPEEDLKEGTPEPEDLKRAKATPIGWVIETKPTIINGFMQHETCTAAFLYALQDLINNGTLSKRVGMVTRSFRPYTLAMDCSEGDWLVTLPGACWYEPIRSYIRDNLDWLQGEILTGGLSYRYDKRCQRVYPKASGQIDWMIKGELGKYGRDQISWLRRNLRLDHASRNAVACIWDAERDLVCATARREKGMQGGDSYTRIPCITGDAIIWTDHGSTHLSELVGRQGFRVLSHTTDHKYAWSMVRAVQATGVKPVVELHYKLYHYKIRKGGPSGVDKLDMSKFSIHTLKCTPEHLIKVRSTLGRQVDSCWQAASSLKKGDLIYGATVYLNLTAVKKVNKLCLAQLIDDPKPAGEEMVYDMQVEGTECFSANGIIVHNCPLTMTATRDDSDRTGDKKALNFVVNWRTQDFTSSTQADIMMCGEIAHWLALTTENRSYNGRLKFDITSYIFGSHGASQFVYYNNLLKWWHSDPRCLNLRTIYPCVSQTKETAKQQEVSQQFLWGQPKQKAYDWFLDRWDDFQKVEYNWRKGQWWHIADDWPKIQYRRWMDWSLALAIFEMSLFDSMRAEVLRLYGHNKQIQRALNFHKEINDYVPFYFLDRIEGMHHYWAALELCSYLIAKQDWTRVDELAERPSVKAKGIFDIILSDALVAQSAGSAVKEFIRERPAVYKTISAHCDIILERGGTV